MSTKQSCVGLACWERHIAYGRTRDARSRGTPGGLTPPAGGCSGLGGTAVATRLAERPAHWPGRARGHDFQSRPFPAQQLQRPARASGRQRREANPLSRAAAVLSSLGGGLRARAGCSPRPVGCRSRPAPALPCGTGTRLGLGAGGRGQAPRAGPFLWGQDGLMMDCLRDTGLPMVGDPGLGTTHAGIATGVRPSMLRPAISPSCSISQSVPSPGCG